MEFQLYKQLISRITNSLIYETRTELHVHGLRAVPVVLISLHYVTEKMTCKLSIARQNDSPDKHYCTNNVKGLN